MTALGTKPLSYWVDTTGSTVFPTARTCSVDVAVIGGGIAGLTAAYLLKREGRRVAVIDRAKIAGGQTGYTTAHLTWIVDQPIYQLRKDFGHDGAARVLASHASAIDAIERIAREEHITCDFARVPAYRFGLKARDKKQLVRDVEESRALGRECEYVRPEACPVPAPGGALRAPDQGRFHPRKYCLELALKVDGGGSFVFEHSPVARMDEGEGVWEVHAGEAVITAGHVLVATNSPFGLVPQLQTRMEPYQTYAIAASVPKGAIPDGLYWDCEDPYQYIRLQPGADRDVLILGGADHKTGSHSDEREAHRALEKYLREVLGIIDYEISNAWSGQVLETVDGVAYIGRAPGVHANRYVATGFGGNGMTYGTIAGIATRDMVIGADASWAKVFDPARVKPVASAVEFVRANASVAAHFLADRFGPAECRSVDDVPPGEGRIVRQGLHKLAVYRDEKGVVTACSAVCTHMGCLVSWNTQGKTWDCPCHGSRFTPTGDVHTGPATEPLAPAEIPGAVPVRAR